MPERKYNPADLNHDRPRRPTTPTRRRPLVKNGGVVGLHDYGPLPLPPAARKRTPVEQGR